MNLCSYSLTGFLCAVKSKNSSFDIISLFSIRLSETDVVFYLIRNNYVSLLKRRRLNMNIVGKDESS